MPNHVTNTLTIEDLGGAFLTDVHGAILNDDRIVDFNVIVPTPECLNDFSPNMGVVSRAKMALGLLEEPENDTLDLLARMSLSNALRDATQPLGEEHFGDLSRAILNFAECGHVYWYDWNNENWGTKWNAYGQPKEGFSGDETTFTFRTAWAHPGELIALVSRKLPNVRFGVKFADEDLGNNCGSYSIINGESQDELIAPRHSEQTPEQKATFTKMAFETVYGDEPPAAHGYDENWQYSEEVYEAYHAA